MLIRVNNKGKLGGNEVFAPVAPIPPINLNDLFLLEVFRTTAYNGKIGKERLL